MSDTVTALQRAFGPILKPFSWVYGRGMRFREIMYSRGLLPSWEPPVPTVSVGNIGWGGTGKTPIAGWLLDWGEKQGLQPLLLTRGYKAKPVSYPYYVQAGALPEEAGDEPLMLAQQHADSHVVVDPIRVRGGKMGLKEFGSRLVVLDDGFQHMAVNRHLNLVLLRPEDLADQWNRVIPAGSWRESVAALKRADAFLIKVGPRNFDKLKPYIMERLGRFRKPTFSFQVMPTGISQVVGDESGYDFGGKEYMLVTGVGNPRQVEQTAKAYFGYGPARHLTFRDHHAYTKTDVMNIQASAKRRNCQYIICTPKDAVKLGPMCTEEFWQFNLRVEFGPSTIGEDTTFDSWWPRRFDSIVTKPSRDRKNKAKNAGKTDG